MKSYQELYREYLELYVHQADEWERLFGKAQGTSPAAEEAYLELNKKVDALKSELILHPRTRALTIKFSGFDQNTYHGEIDEALKERFGESFVGDSEGGQFTAFCGKDISLSAKSFLEETFPSLKFTVQDAAKEAQSHEDISFMALVPGATNWPTARKTLAELQETEGKGEKKSPAPEETSLSLDINRVKAMVSELEKINNTDLANIEFFDGERPIKLSDEKIVMVKRAGMSPVDFIMTGAWHD